MKKSLRISLMIVALGVIFGCAGNSFAQQVPVIVGGYSPVAVTDREVVKAADYAVKAESKKMKLKYRLVSISAAQQQVVAGMNYQVCLNVEYDVRNKNARIPKTIKQTAQAVVYKNIKQRYSLTEWTPGGCPKQ